MAKIFSITKTSKSSSISKELKDSYCACDVPVEKSESEQSDDEIDEKPEVEKKKSIWETILQESKERDAPYIEWLKEREEIPMENINSPADYLNREIFPTLLPAMENMLREAEQWNALRVQKCLFNGLDYLAEYLWNNNSRWPRRSLGWIKVFDIPLFKICMRLNPRPIFPKSWLWSENEAATHIQRWVRGWLIRKREDVQELRQFWKAIENDNENLGNKSRTDSQNLDLCERYKLLAKKGEKPL